MENHYDDNGDLVVTEKTTLRQVGWQINGGANDGLIIGRMDEEKLKARLKIPHGSFSPVYVQVGD